ncbi:uncharacterized protein METZ01_LOCUS247416 [marine metagenome]|uniref:Uncharacterized protein n=1 Tax=marine metagenome TaxID=408172 RepID=A0A382I5G1_9ZZZZ
MFNHKYSFVYPYQKLIELGKKDYD